jgi:hypothetical protein
VVVADDRVLELGAPAPGVRAWALRLESRPEDARIARLDAEEAAGLATMRPAAATRLLARRALLHRVAAGAAGCPVGPSTCTSYPGTGTEGEPALIGIGSSPRRLETMGHPVSVCHQLSTTGTPRIQLAHA